MSGFETLQRIENDLRARGKISTPLNRAGLAYEYRATFDARMHAALGPRFAPGYAWLGYERDLSGMRSPSSIPGQDIERLLAAMQADQMAQPAQDWLRKHIMAASADIVLDRWPH